MRRIVLLIYLGSFLLVLANLIGISPRVWSMMTLEEIGSVLLSVVLSLCGVLLAFWLYDDNIEIERMRGEIDKLRSQVHRLEKPES